MFEKSAFGGSQTGSASSVVPELRWSPQARLDVARAILEVGPGGDVDADAHLTRADYSYVPGLKRTVSIWLRLYERAQRGEIGGQHDGATRVVARAPVAPASTAA